MSAMEGNRGGPLARIAERILAGELSDMREAVETYGALAFTQTENNALLAERIAELELAIEDEGWVALSADNDYDFSRRAITEINRMSRIYWVKNPLIKRAVYTQTAYVFGQGVTFTTNEDDVDDVIRTFLDDPKNIAELTGHQALMLKETELQIDANLFLVFFTEPKSGRVRVRSIPTHQIADIVCNPEDAKEPWFYLREWNQRRSLDDPTLQTYRAYYPDFRYRPRRLPRSIGGIEVRREPVYHVKVNALSDMKYGVSEVYAAVDWARAYKEFLEDWVTLVKSLSKFAWKFTAKAGAKGMEAARAKLDADINTDPLVGNLPPSAGSVVFMNDAAQLDPIPKTGATTSVTDGRRLLLMVSAATGIFEHYFGDPSTGNLATSTAMERPMELMFRDRQQLWRDILGNVCDFVIRAAIKAGTVAGTITADEYDEEVIESDLDLSVNITFPDLLDKDVKQRIDAIVSAITLGGNEPQHTIDLKTATKMLLETLGADAIDDLLTTLFPDDPVPWSDVEEEEEAKAEQMQQQFQPGGGGGGPGEEEEPYGEAIAEMKETVRHLAGVLLQEHLPGKHDQRSHGRGRGGGVSSGASGGSGTKDDPWQTDDVEFAAQAIARGEHVELKEETQVVTLVDKLADYTEQARQAQAKGELDKLPTYDLCNASVSGTNLFCVESKGVPRVMMPQLTGKPKPGSKADKMERNEWGEVNLGESFLEHLQSRGYSVTEGTREAHTLRASQRELNGAKVAGISGAIERGEYDPTTGRIWCTSDRYVVDGHHRWAATVHQEIKHGRSATPDIPVREVDATIIEVLAMANNYTKSMGIWPERLGESG